MKHEHKAQQSQFDDLFDSSNERIIPFPSQPGGTPAWQEGAPPHQQPQRPAWLKKRLLETSDKVAPKILKIAIYIRYSTDRQKLDSSVRQHDNCVMHAERFFPGAELVPFKDLEKSGATMQNRFALEDMLDRCKAGEFDAVIVEDADRLSRSLTDMAAIWAILKQAGVALHSVFHGRALGDQDVATLGAASSAEREKFLRRSEQARALMAKNGRHPTGPAYGYVSVRNKKGQADLIIDPATQGTVRLIFELTLDGLSTTEIADELNARGIPSPGGKLWQDSVIAQMLKNARYTGWLIYNRFTYKNGKPVRNPPEKWITSYRADLAIVSVEEADLAIEILSSRAPRNQQGGPHSRYLLSKIGTCGLCGARLALRGVSTKNRVRMTYCSDHKRFRTCSNSEMVPVQVIEQAVLGAVVARLDGAALEKVAEAFNAERERRGRSSKEKRAGLQRQIGELTHKLRSSLDRSLTAGIPDDILREERQGWTEQLQEARSALAELEVECAPATVDAAAAQEIVAKLRTVVPGVPFKAGDVAGCKLVEAFHELVGKVVVQPRTKDGKVPIEIHGRITEVVLGIKDEDCSDGVIKVLCAPPHTYGSLLDPGQLEHAAASRCFALSPGELAIVEPLVRRSSHKPKPGDPSLEEVMHFIFFVLRTNVSWERAPASLGDNRHLINAVKRLVYSGSWDAIVSALNGTSRGTLEGLNLARVRQMQRDRAAGLVAPHRPTIPRELATPDEKVVNAIVALLRAKGEPMRRVDILAHLQASGIVLRGSVPSSMIKLIIWQSDRLIGIRPRGIWLAGVPLRLPGKPIAALPKAA